MLGTRLAPLRGQRREHVERLQDADQAVIPVDDRDGISGTTQAVDVGELRVRRDAAEDRIGEGGDTSVARRRSEEHTSELQSHLNLVCRLLLEKKNNKQ